MSALGGPRPVLETPNEGLTTTPSERQLWLPLLSRARRLHACVRVNFALTVAAPYLGDPGSLGCGHERPTKARRQATVATSRRRQTGRSFSG